MESNRFLKAPQCKRMYLRIVSKIACFAPFVHESTLPSLTKCRRHANMPLNITGKRLLIRPSQHASMSVCRYVWIVVFETHIRRNIEHLLLAGISCCFLTINNSNERDVECHLVCVVDGERDGSVRAAGSERASITPSPNLNNTHMRSVLKMPIR